jgi:hypothetical protein
MSDQNQREIDNILDRHDEVARHAQGDAIDALRAANQAALRLSLRCVRAPERLIR